MYTRKNGTRYIYNYLWCDVKNAPYDYDKNGLIQHIMSKKIAESQNKPLQIILRYFEDSLIYLMKATDFLKNFKNYHWFNR